MSIGKVQKQSFEERLSRISEGGENTMGQLVVGPPDESIRAGDAKAAKPKKRKQKRKKKAGSSDGPNVLMLPLALILGAMSVFAGRMAGFHLLTDEGLFPIQVPVEQLYLYGDLAFAGLLALMFTWTFGMSTMVRKMAVVAGFAAMMSGEPRVIEAFPDVYATFFSDSYVTDALDRA